MIDRYTKIILTVIAAALIMNVWHNFAGSAGAQMSGCGMTWTQACYVSFHRSSLPLLVTTTN